jgi:hypothetical protein
MMMLRDQGSIAGFPVPPDPIRLVGNHHVNRIGGQLRGCRRDGWSEDPGEAPSINAAGARDSFRRIRGRSVPSRNGVMCSG